MDIKSNSLFAQMQSMAVEATGNRHAETSQINKSSEDFGNLFKDAINNVQSLQQDSKEKTTAFEMGDRSITLAETMIARQKSGVAFEATVQVRNKFVEAYKEIMSMPV